MVLLNEHLDHTVFNCLDANLNSTCHLLVLLGAQHIFHVSGIRVNCNNTHKYNCRTKRYADRNVTFIILQLPFSHPLTYVEFLIRQLTELQINIDLDSLYSVSIKVLDVAYIRHHEIYLKLFHMITGRWERTPRER